MEVRARYPARQTAGFFFAIYPGPFTLAATFYINERLIHQVPKPGLVQQADFPAADIDKFFGLEITERAR